MTQAKIISQQTNFTIRTNVFEGPLDLLLSLIEQRKLHISDISLIQIVDDFIAHLLEVSYSEQELMSFLKVLSTLLLIKSRALLPQPTFTKEERAEINLLTDHLTKYTIVKQRSQTLAKLINYTNRSQFISISPKKTNSYCFRADDKIENTTLHKVALLLIYRRPNLAQHYKKITIEKKIQLDQIISNLLTSLQRRSTLSFNSLITQNRDEKILHFLALLELVKMGNIITYQQGDDIIMHNSSIQTPHYGI